MPRRRKKIIDIASAIVLMALAALDVAMARTILSAYVDMPAAAAPRIYFFSVTQGAAALLVLPDDITVLTGAGSDAGIVDDLQKILPPGSGQYIDLAIIPSASPGDYEGYYYLLQHYRVGAFLYNGRSDAEHASEWRQLTDAIAAAHVPLVTIGAGDSVRYDAGGGSLARIDILSPDAAFAHSPDPGDTNIVQRVVTARFTALIAPDIDSDAERALSAREPQGLLQADILAAPLPALGGGAPGDAFLRAIAPRGIVLTSVAGAAVATSTRTMLARIASSTGAAVITPKSGRFLLYNK